MSEANARVAETACGRAVCTEASTRIRGQSRLAERSALVERLVEAVEGSQAAVDEHRRPTVGILPPTRQQQGSEQKNENRRKGGNKRGKKKAALGAGQHDEVVQHSEGSRQEGEEVVAAYTPRAEGEEAVAPG